jgi:hypothetical protein
MSIEITTAMVSQYNATIQILMQQKEARFAPAVRLEPGTVGKDAFFDQIGQTAAIKRTARHADTPQVNTPHLRRKVTMCDYDWADLVDNMDTPKILTDPTSKYVQNAVFALNRAKDLELYSVFNATVYGGQDGTTSYAFPAANVIDDGTAGMTLAKLISAKEMLDKNDVDENDRFIVCSSREFTDMLDIEELTSADYATVRALVNGQINTFLGFTFIRYEKLTQKTATIRSCFAWQKNSMLLAIGKDVITDVGPRRDKNMAVQAYAGMSIGATRMDEMGVIEIESYHA